MSDFTSRKNFRGVFNRFQRRNEMDKPEDDSARNGKGFFDGRKPAVIGCLLVVLFVIAIFAAIFVLGTMEATPDDINNPGP
jgi:hypothetical protein